MRPSSWLGGVLVAGLALGCGSSGGSMTGTTTTTTGSTPPVSVSIAEYSFSPDTARVKVGGNVVWTNAGTVAHTATADGGSFDSGQLSAPSGGGAYGGGSSGASYSYTFGTAGTYSYHCANHPTTMKGVVIVTP